MAQVLIVDSNERFARKVSRALTEVGHQSSIGATPDEAVAQLHQSSFDVLIVADHVEGQRTVPLVEWIQRAHRRTRFVVVGDITTFADCRAMLRLGAVDLLPRSADPTEFAEAVGRALELASGWRCDLHGLPLFDILQTLHHARRSCRLVASGECPGVVDLVDGEVVHAACGEWTGESALASLVASAGGRVASYPFRCGERTIRRSFDALMIEVVRQLDEGVEPSRVAVRPSTRPPSALAPAMAAIFADTFRCATVGAEVDTGVQSVVDATCNAVVRSVDGALACAVIDLDSDAVIGMDDQHGARSRENLVRIRAAANLLRPRAATKRGASAPAPAEESAPIESIHLATEHESQFVRAIRGGGAAVVLLTRRGVDVGWGWSQLGSWLPVVESVVT